MDVPAVSVQEAASAASGGAALIDVREPDEVREVRATGVRPIPLAQIPDRVGEIPTDGPVYLICRSGGRSGQAAAYLREHGVDAINVAGGTLAWVEAELPTEHG